MRGRQFAIGVCAVLAVASLAAQRPKPDVVAGADGNVTIVPITHGTLELLYNDAVILVDPARFGPASPPPALPPPPPGDRAGRPGAPPSPDPSPNAVPVTPAQMTRFKNLKPPTLILITDVHEDHLDAPAIAAIRGPRTQLVAPAAVIAQLPDTRDVVALANGKTTMIGGVTIEAVPMYNVRPDPQFNQIFHEKGRGDGYIVTLGSKRFYIAGDTACTPEMKALTNIDVAFLPMNLPYTMSPSEAAECAKAFKPKVVYPYHYFSSDPKTFEAAMKGSGIEVRLRDWYMPTPARER